MSAQTATATTDDSSTEDHALATFVWPMRIVWSGLGVMCAWYAIQYGAPLVAWLGR